MSHDRPVLVSIVGMVRSGSTFLEGRIADLYGGVAVGELLGAWGAFARGDVLCSCGEAATDCTFWSQVCDRYPGLVEPETVTYMTEVNGDLMSLRRVLRWPGVIGGRRALPRYQKEATALLAAVGKAAAEHGFQLVIDSSKHPVYHALVSRCPQPDYCRLLTLRLVRDPRAVVHSLTTPKLDPTLRGPQLMKGYSVVRALPFWVAMNEYSDQVVESDAGRFRYEDTEREQFRGWLSSYGLCDDWTRPGAHHQLIANPIRHERAAFRVDDRWKRAQSPAVSLLTAVAALPWMRRYGYRLREQAHGHRRSS